MCYFINFSSFILNMDMPFPLSFNKSYFTIKDHSGNIHHLDVNDTFACETALIYLYQDLRYMQQHAGVDLNLLKGVFDVKSLANSPFLGRWFSIPSLPMNKVLPPKIELKLESQSESEDEWEVLS
ncbi:unnamed protein product [Blepharisma stoltei]|uniref:Uncharacterized protein n=1 Tax=Blepharisma stoltei TaxID=1481888 RepID=A0AAU9JWL5_9CILI|nr:unnamed protein product [Blepharisma stoltei]